MKQTQLTELEHIRLKNTILETKDYKMFNRLPGNRTVSERLIDQLMESYLEKPQLRIARPLLCNEKMEIVDGQHRKEASERLRISIYYMVVPKLTVQDARLLNAMQKSWTLYDFAKSYADTGNEEYIRFLNLFKEYRVPIAVLLDYANINAPIDRAKENMRQMFRTGRFEFYDEEVTLSMLNDLQRFGEFVAGWNEQSFAHATLRLFKMKDFDLERMLRKFEAGASIPHRGSSADYLRDLEIVYNKNVPFGHQVRFI